jgi:hypothetical protein
LPYFLAAADTYWDAWHPEAAAVSRCDNRQRLASFMVRALQNIKNVERTEANSEVFEKLIISNPTCFLRSAARLKRNSCKLLMKRFVDSPLYHDEREMRDALNSAGITIRGCYDS